MACWVFLDIINNINIVNDFACILTIIIGLPVGYSTTVRDLIFATVSFHPASDNNTKVDVEKLF
jgi:hypothetical protein